MLPIVDNEKALLLESWKTYTYRYKLNETLYLLYSLGISLLGALLYYQRRKYENLNVKKVAILIYFMILEFLLSIYQIINDGYPPFINIK